MALTDALIPEFDHEMTVTRKLLERVPEDKFDWKPHRKATALGGLAAHVANLASWGEITLTQPDLDIGGSPHITPPTTRAELLAMFDRNVARTRTALAGKSDAELMAPWSLKRDGHTIFTMPKASIWRSFVMSHLVHHRGQLSVYLRMQDVALPSIYGPSADESPF